MHWLLLGVLLGLLLAVPPLGAVFLGVAAAVVSQPVVVAFSLGLLARPLLSRMRGWAQ